MTQTYCVFCDYFVELKTKQIFIASAAVTLQCPRCKGTGTFASLKALQSNRFSNLPFRDIDHLIPEPV